jgi:hypothetical protein
VSARTTVVLERQAPLDMSGLEELSWPPPPHDPRERELTLSIDGWEVRLFGGRMFAYFVTRKLWHMQLWHPTARISILTPSRLTRGSYEVFPLARWKSTAPDYPSLVRLITGLRSTPLPSAADVLRLERALVHDVVRARSEQVS